MRRYEDYSCWSRYLPLVSCMTKTLCQIIEKEISSPVNCCRKVQFEIKLLNITHTWCSSVFARSLNKAIRQKPRITQYELRKNVYQIFTFLVSTNASWFHSYLRKLSGKFLSTPIARKIPFANPVLLQNFQEMFSFLILRILAIVIGSCGPV